MYPHEHLFQLQSKENDGRGVACVRNICFYLGQNDNWNARLVFENDFDKIRNYPALVEWLNDFFQTKLR